MDTTETRADATRHLKDIGCKIFQVLDAGDAKILFDHYRGLGARLDELLVPAVCAKAHVFVRLLLDAGVMVGEDWPFDDSQPSSRWGGRSGLRDHS